MKASGLVRRVDDLGRVVIPKEIRRILCVSEGDPLEIFYDESNVCFRKYNANANYINNLRSIKNVMHVDPEFDNPEVFNKMKEILSLLENKVV